MLGRLAAKDKHDKRPLKPQIYQGRGRGQNRNFNQRNSQNRNGLNNRSNSRDRGQFRDRPRSEQNYRGSNFQGNIRGCGRQNSRREYRDNNYRHNDSKRAGIDQDKGYSQRITVAIELEVQIVADLGQDPEPVLIGTE